MQLFATFSPDATLSSFGALHVWDVPLRCASVWALGVALLGVDRKWPVWSIAVLCGFACAVAATNLAVALSFDTTSIYRLLFALMIGPLTLGIWLASGRTPLVMGLATLCATVASGPVTVAAVKSIEQRLLPFPDFVMIVPPGNAVALVLMTIGLLMLASRRAIDYQENRGRRLGAGRAVPLLLAVPCFVGLLDLIIFMLEPARWILIVTMVTQTAVLGILMLWIFRLLADERSTARAFARVADLTPIALVDGDGRIVHWSRGCEMLYGWSAKEALGKVKSALLQSQGIDDQERMHSSDSAIENELIEQHRDGAKLHILERRLVTEDHTEQQVTVLSMTDISQRVATEVALRDSDARLTLAAEAHAIAIFEWTAKHDRLRWINDTETQLGVPAGTMTEYASWRALCFPADLEELDKRIEATIWAKAERFSFFYRLSLPSGEVRAVEGSARCFYDENGRLERTIGVNIDVTARVDREAQLAAREAQLRSILDTVPSAMIVIDEHGVILTFSKAAEQLFGYSAAVAVGKNVSVLIADIHLGSYQDGLARFLESGERRMIGAQRMMTAVHADGHQIPVEVRVGEARYSDTRVFTAFVQDISDRLKNEERLDNLRSELTHVGRLNAMGELAAGLAHEINQPLSAIANYMATAEMMLDDDQLKRSRLRAQLGAARQQSLRAGQIIRRMRDFASKRETDSRVELVHSVIEEATTLVLTGYDRLGIDIEYDLSDSALYMLGDRIQVQQVLVNLLRNSMDAVAGVPREHRVITIGSRSLDNEMLELSVSDSGPGIAQEVLNEIYMPFKTTKGESGMGIGLSICRRIVEAHGGTLSAENKPEGGARFRFTLPRVEKEEVSA
ncbi:PAS domain S-box protein [Stakelama sp. CBK3Z-3]|uniref:histidine kinase n=1 Tax=Stakelama flava TaxID=2860338 RepID=A0ABS6XJR8_9SPHN|nr:PAS domain S-box protein [Stakelama flava]